MENWLRNQQGEKVMNESRSYEFVPRDSQPQVTQKLVHPLGVTGTLATIDVGPDSEYQKNLKARRPQPVQAERGFDWLAGQEAELERLLLIRDDAKFSAQEKQGVVEAREAEIASVTKRIDFTKSAMTSPRTDKRELEGRLHGLQAKLDRLQNGDAQHLSLQDLRRQAEIKTNIAAGTQRQIDKLLAENSEEMERLQAEREKVFDPDDDADRKVMARGRRIIRGSVDPIGNKRSEFQVDNSRFNALGELGHQ
jgi:hypothetical protein